VLRKIDDEMLEFFALSPCPSRFLKPMRVNFFFCPLSIEVLKTDGGQLIFSFAPLSIEVLKTDGGQLIFSFAPLSIEVCGIDEGPLIFSFGICEVLSIFFALFFPLDLWIPILCLGFVPFLGYVRFLLFMCAGCGLSLHIPFFVFSFHGVPQ
jgi:hypothetical protein